MKTLQYAVVGTESHQYWLEACTVCGRPGAMLKNDKVVPNQFILNLQVKYV
jgi:hypothetical protein